MVCFIDAREASDSFVGGREKDDSQEGGYKRASAGDAPFREDNANVFGRPCKQHLLFLSTSSAGQKWGKTNRTFVTHCPSPWSIPPWSMPPWSMCEWSMINVQIESSKYTHNKKTDQINTEIEGDGVTCKCNAGRGLSATDAVTS